MTEAEARVARAKRRARAQLSDPAQWRRRGYAQSLRLDPEAVPDAADRLDGRRLTADRFAAEFAGRPQVIAGLAEEWAAATEWSPGKLAARTGDRPIWRVGCSPEGDPVRLSLCDFLDYCAGGAAEDDSPLYVFDWDFGEQPGLGMLAEYQPPGLFGEDLMELLAHLNSRPPHRWMIIGPGRSGSPLHQDPLGTSAWNTLLAGHKQWAIFPPEAPEHLLLPPELLPDPKELGGAAQWFSNVLPEARIRPEWRPIEILQKPGETLYVPAGWWHAVLNLDTTVAVTQNFAEPRNFDQVWAALVEGRGDLVPELHNRLRVERPELAARADRLGGVAAAQASMVERERVGDLFASLLEWPGECGTSSDSD